MTSTGSSNADSGDTAASAAIEQGKLYAAAVEKMRLRTDTAAKTLGALATTAITAVGLVKFSDVFPFATDQVLSWVYVVVMVLGFLVIATATAWFVFRFWRSNRPVVMSSQPSKIIDLDGTDEMSRVTAIYQQVADLNNARSLYAYEARGWRFSAIAERLGDDSLAKYLTAQAEAITAEVKTTQFRALLNIVRMRSANMITGWRTVIIVGLFLAGVLMLGIGADYLASERTDRVAMAKACAEAQKVIREQGLPAADLLPAICRPSQIAPAADKPKPGEVSETATTLTALTTQYQECVSAAIQAGDSDAKACGLTLSRIKNIASE
jgi:hypothetical protein